MAEDVHNAPARVRCLSCGHVDAPTRVGPGPGWIAVALWLLTAVFWMLASFWEPFGVGFLVTLFIALVYTLWYFAKREKACRHCGARGVEPDPGTAA